MPSYTVTIPIAGHAVISVEAESEEVAIEMAFMQDITIDDIETWETLTQFNKGNVCYCPRPWEIEAVEE